MKYNNQDARDQTQRVRGGRTRPDPCCFKLALGDCLNRTVVDFGRRRLLVTTGHSNAGMPSGCLDHRLPEVCLDGFQTICEGLRVTLSFAIIRRQPSVRLNYPAMTLKRQTIAAKRRQTSVSALRKPVEELPGRGSHASSSKCPRRVWSRRVRGDFGPQQWQWSTPAQSDQRHRPDRRRAYLAGRPGPDSAGRPSANALPTTQHRFHLPVLQSDPDADSVGKRHLAAGTERRQAAGSARSAEPLLDARVCWIGRPPSPTGCRAASSSGSPSHARWFTTRCWCWPMNRLATWTRKPASKSWHCSTGSLARQART